MTGAPYDLLLFDFDGVLFNTNRIKTEAFRQTLADYPRDKVDAFVRYHELNGGISRHIKFAHFFDYILGSPAPASAVDDAISRFATVVVELMQKAEPLPGVATFLDSVKAKAIPMIICSGGNAEEIRNLLARHEMTDHFLAVLGNEESKLDHARERIAPDYSRVLFFGDSRYDMEVAEAFNFDFAFVTAVTDWPEGEQRAGEQGHRVISDFDDPAFTQRVLSA